MASRDLFWRILKAMAQTAIDLDLAGIGGHVYLQLVPDDTTGYDVVTGQLIGVVFPAVLFSLDGETEERAHEDTGTKGWTFPVRCFVADRNQPRNHARLPVYLGARKALFDLYDERPETFRNAGIPEVINALVVPQILYDPKLPVYQYVVSGFGVRVETEEER